MTLNIKLYAPRNTVSFTGRTHVWIHENVSGKRGKCADLDIAMEGVPDIVAPEFVYGKTKKKIDPMTWTVKSSRTTVLDATLSGYSFRIPKREYKKAPGGAAITGKMKNLAGSTV